MEALLRDTRLALRNLLKNKGFTLAALLCLALGMGASSTLFSVVDTVLLRPLPFTDPDRIVMIWNQFLLQDTPKAPASVREFLDLQSQSTVFESIAAVAPQFVALSGDGNEPQELLAGRATAGIFPVLGVQASLGRVFSPEEDVFGQNEVAVLSHKLWAERFGSDPEVVGQKIILDGRPFVVTGVMPADFTFSNFDFDLWIPQGLSPERLAPRHIRFVTLMGKLRPGVGLERAQAEMNAIAKRFESDYPESYPAESGYRIHLVPAQEDLVGQVRLTLLVLFGAAGLVLLISCLNVANLLLTRSTSRAKEVAIRTALGSSRAVLIRQFLMEGIVLSFFGALLGLLLAFFTSRALVALNPGNIPRMDEVHLDGRVLLFNIGVVLLTGGLFGLVPALHSSARNVRGPLQDGGKTSGGTTAGRRTRSALVVAEIAVALVVLVGAGLMIQSFRGLLDVDPGFSTEGALTARFSLTRGRYPEEAQTLIFQQQLVEQVSALPGVKSAALTSDLPMGRELGISGDLTVEGKILGSTEPPPVTGWIAVTPDYFKAMEIQLTQGRAFTWADSATAPGVVIVDEKLAHRLWPGVNPLGKRLKLNARTPEQSIWRTVVGVSRQIRQHGLADMESDQLYVPSAQYGGRQMTLVVRPAARPESYASEVRRTFRSLDPDLPVDVKTIDEVIDESLTRQRFHTFLFASFGAIALALTLIGVYGVVAYSVAQRTRDVGIRMALGARKEDVLRLIVGEGARLTIVGLVLGLAVAWSMSRLMTTFLYGVEAGDALTFIVVSLLLGLLVLLASYLPARRAAKVDPLVALRYD